MQRTCEACGVDYQAKHPTSKTCSERCKKRRQRGARQPANVTELPRKTGRVEATTVETLTEADRLDTPLGQATLELARRLDNSDRETGQGLSSLAKQFQSMLEAATAGAHVEADPIDELRRARDRKRASAG
jgi:hypothetical protein